MLQRACWSAAQWRPAPAVRGRESRGTNMQERFDILKEEPPGEFLWLEAVPTVEVAAARIEVLAKNTTGRFIVFDQRLQATVSVPARSAAAS